MAFVHSLGYSFDPIYLILAPSIVQYFILYLVRSESAVELQVAHRYRRIGMSGCILCVHRQEGKKKRG